MKKLILLLLISLMGCASIQHNVRTWNWKNTVLQASCITLLAVDTVQTSNNARDNWVGHKETNPILGSYPHQDKVYGYMASFIVFHTVLAIILPEDYRTSWQLGCVVVETDVTINNERVRRNVK
jgi:hypothetical protein